MEWWNVFQEQVRQTTWLEAIAVITGISSVWFSKQEKIWVYPVGIVSVLIYVYLGWAYKLYADAGVNFYYFIMSVYGWYHWTDTPGHRGQIPISSNSRNDNMKSMGLYLLSFALLYLVLSIYTDSDVPLWDGSTTAAAITAMWLMARKKVEHWIFWLVCDISSIPLYAYKGLWFTSFQFIVFTALAWAGLRAWRRKLKFQTNG